jgi:hypothetical protein
MFLGNSIEAVNAGDKLPTVRQVDVVTPSLDCGARDRITLALEGPSGIDNRINTHLREPTRKIDVICIDLNELLWAEAHLLHGSAATRAISAADQ